jgi:hypothetical protein
VKVIASIEDEAVIGRILAYLQKVAAAAAGSLMDGVAAHRARGPSYPAPASALQKSGGKDRNCGATGWLMAKIGPAGAAASGLWSRMGSGKVGLNVLVSPETDIEAAYGHRNRPKRSRDWFGFDIAGIVLFFST